MSTRSKEHSISIPTPSISEIEQIVTAAENTVLETPHDEREPSECTEDANSWSEWMSPARDDDEEVTVEEPSTPTQLLDKEDFLECKQETTEEDEPAVKQEKDEDWMATRNAYCSRCYARAKRICAELGLPEVMEISTRKLAHRLAHDKFNAAVGGR